MTYSTNNLHLVTSIGGGRGQTWIYEGTETAATVIAGTFISDGQDRGMAVGDTLFVREYTSAAFTALTSLTMHAVTGVASTGATAGAAISGSGSNFLNSGSATIAVTDDVVDGYLIGSIYVETDTTPDEPYVCTNNATGAAVWQSMANDAVLSVVFPTLTSAAQTIRLVSPFAGKLTAVRAIVTTVATGATDKLVRTVISGVTVTSGTITLADGAAAGTVYSALPTTANTLLAGNQITLQSGTQPCATGVFNFYITCRKMIG